MNLQRSWQFQMYLKWSFKFHYVDIIRISSSLIFVVEAWQELKALPINGTTF